jgi:HD superfamily phosphohydrolase YqeK
MRIDIKEIYNLITKEEAILDIYQQIEEKEIRDEDWAFHNLDHVNNVTRVAEKILRDLKFKEEDIYKVKIACFLHDVGELAGKAGHAYRSYIYAQDYFSKQNWDFDGKEEVLDAIKNHSEGFDSNSIITLSVVLADKLDVKKTRIPESGMKIIGNRQFAHIEDILLNIESNKLIINFITDGNIDHKEVNEYYFTHKIFKSIQTFAEKLNLTHEIFMDDKIWTLDKINA